MGFLDKAKVLADQAVAKADAAMGSATAGHSAKQADGYFRDLGVLAYLDSTGRTPADADEQRERCMTAIQQIEGQGPLNFSMSTMAPPAPGTAAGAPPAPGTASGAPPAPGTASGPPPAPGAGATSPPPGPATAPVAPPPPPGSVQQQPSQGDA